MRTYSVGLVDLDSGEMICSYSEDKRTIFDSDTGEIISIIDLGERDKGLILPYYNFAWLEVITHNTLKKYLLQQWINKNGAKEQFRAISINSFRLKDYYHSWLFRTAFYSAKERDKNGRARKIYVKRNEQKILRQTQTNRVIREIWRAYPELRQYIEDQGLI